MNMRPTNGKHYEPIKPLDEDEPEPMPVRPLLRNHPVDDAGVGEYDEFEDNYSGEFRHLICSNQDTLSSYLDELEDLDELGVNLAYTRPVAKFRRTKPRKSEF
jgi:hypothetical protein